MCGCHDVSGHLTFLRYVDLPRELASRHWHTDSVRWWRSLVQAASSHVALLSFPDGLHAPLVDAILAVE